jgi:flagellin-like hook-associated protein FlgL
MNADVAEESSALVKTSIRNNVTAAILAQANVQPRIALDLLKNV